LASSSEQLSGGADSELIARDLKARISTTTHIMIFAPNVSVRVATENVGGRKIARNLHRSRTPCCTPTVR
jgi:hypothetical protein